MTYDTTELVTLPGGPTVTVEPIARVIELERRGVRLDREGDVIVATPGDLLSAEDLVWLRRLKPEVLSLITYVNSPTARV